MTVFLKGSFAGLLLTWTAFMPASPVEAGTLPDAPPLPPAPELIDFSDPSGWYLRADAGLALSAKPDPIYGLLDAGSSTRAPGSFMNSNLAHQGVFDIGGGYNFGSWLRTDATLEYRAKAAFTGNDQYVCLSCSSATVNGQWSGRVSSIVGLFNVYADIGTWSGLTPYVGLGLGVAYNKTSSVVENGTISGAPFDRLSSGGKGKANFAWALMTGLAYDINSTTKLEFGYRYIHLGSAFTGNETPVSGAGGSTPDDLRLRHLAAQEFRIGIRWMLDGAPAGAQAD